VSTIVFDLDGTLVDVRLRHYQVYADALGEVGVEPLGPGAYWSRRRSGAGTFEIVSGLPGPIYSRFTAMWTERVEAARYLALDRVFPGAPQMLTAFAADYELLLLTLRWNRDALLDELRDLGLDGAFSAVISPGAGDERRKSALLAGRELGADAWVIGDSEADVKLAADVGAEFVGLTCGVRSPAFLRQAGAVKLADSPAELVDAVGRVTAAGS